MSDPTPIQIDLTDPDAVRAIQRRREYNRTHGRPLDAPLPTEALPEVERRKIAMAEARDWKEEQRQVWALFRSLGAHVYWLSQARKTGQTPGLGDLWVMHPKWRAAWWWETKHGSAAGRPLSPAQEEFQALALGSGTLAGAGTRRDAEQWLIDRGMAEREPSGSIVALPPPPDAEDHQGFWRNRWRLP